MKITLPLLFATLPSLTLVAPAQTDSGPALTGERTAQILKSAQADLARQGLSIDPLPTLRAVSAEEWRAIIDGHLARKARQGVFEARRLLADALSHKVPSQADDFRAECAARVAGEVLVHFDPASGSFAYDAQRALDSSSFERHVIEQLVLAARERRTPRQVVEDAARRPTSEQEALAAAMHSGEAAVRAAAVLEARGTRVPEVDSPRGNAVERLRGSGRAFMVQRQLLGGLGALDGAFDEPPASTEQLLHPIKLYRDRPREVIFPEFSAAAAPKRIVCDDQLGELGVLEILLEAGVERDRARIAASGWDGDRLLVLEGADGAVAQIWRLYFDRPDDVRQFVELWRAKASGRIIARALTCDWIRSSSVAWATQLEQELAAAPPKLQPSPEDQESTAEVEAELAAAFSRAPTLEGSLWRVPQFDFSMRVPESWKLEVFEGVPYVFAEQVERYRDNISVAEIDAAIDASTDELLERQTRVITKQPGLRLIKAEKRPIDGRAGVFLRYSSDSGAQQLEFAVAMFVRNKRLVAVTTCASRATWPTLETLIDAAYRTIEVRPSGGAAK